MNGFIYTWILLFLPFQAFADHQFLGNQSEIQHYLENRIQRGYNRYPSFILALQLLKERNAQVIVETGCSRHGDKNFWGDGGSTVIFGNWAHDHGVKLYTVDIANWAIKAAKEATTQYADAIEYICSDSIPYLSQFNQPIDFLYLDSFDFDVNNPKPSQEHHLREIIAAYPHLHSRTIVMIDDCDLPDGGKGPLVIEYLMARGWKILFKGYQTILIYE